MFVTINPFHPTLLLSMISKVFGKISVSFRIVQILGFSDLAMAKDEKVNIKVTNTLVKYLQAKLCHYAECDYAWCQYAWCHSA